MAVKLHHGDCLDVMQTLPDHSFDAIIADLPYGTTACKWDSVIPFEPLWAQYKRLIKKRGAIVLFGSQPFTSALVMSNVEWFKYCWVWDKVRGVGFQIAKFRPMMQHEDLCVFGNGAVIYNPQMMQRETVKRSKCYTASLSSPLAHNDEKVREYRERYPTSIIIESNADQTCKVHPTQKPVALLEYLIKTYTNPGDTILDNCFGSCTTGIACLNTSRNFVGIEMDSEYFKIGHERVSRRMIELGEAPVSCDMTDKDISDSQVHLPPIQMQMREMVLCDEQV